MGRSSSDTNSVTNNNSVITAENGILKTNSGDDTNVIGANLLAKEVDILVGRLVCARCNN